MAESHQIAAATAALMYAAGSLFSKRALIGGGGVTRLTFVMNQTFLAIFAASLVFGPPPSADGSAWAGPVVAGLFFFGGQIFTVAAIRAGDVSVQTPVMGSKVVFAVIFLAALGKEAVSGEIWTSAALAFVGVALLGYSGRRGGSVVAGLLLALLSAVFFAAADVMVGLHGAAFGARPFVVIMIAVNAALSHALIPFFRGPLRALPKAAWGSISAASAAMGVQALIVNLALATSGEVAEINIVYSSRGFWSVVLAVPAAMALSIPREVATRRMFVQRLAGTLLMSAAIALVLSGD